MHWRFIPFTVVLALLVGWAHVYLYRRLFGDTSTDPRWRRVGRISLWVLGLSAIGARFITALLPRAVSRPVQGIGWFWLALAIYLLLTFAALDLLRWAWRFFRSWQGEPEPASAAIAAAAGPVDIPVPVPDVMLKGGPATAEPAAGLGVEGSGIPRRIFLARAAGAGALAVAGGASAFGIFRAYYPPAVSEVPVRLRGLPRELDGFTIVQLSDVHAGQSVHEAWMGELADRCAALRPDLFVVTGDLVDGSVPQLGGVVARLQKIQASEGSWFVTGNHDYYAGADAWCAALHKMGFQVLRNRHTAVGGGAGQPSFDLIGVDDYGQTLRADGTGYD
ncbi:MAG TPA: metallophosphoesterase, partial [Myxococcaceae bacterium]|nr:metallophosphoesterase [Myxococcaceae bacterium]